MKFGEVSDGAGGELAGKTHPGEPQLDDSILLALDSDP